MARDFTKLDPVEKTRSYIFEGGEIVFENVTAIHISNSGTHYLELISGKKAIVKPNWLAIEIDVPEWTF